MYAFENNINVEVTFLHAVTVLPKLLPELSVLLPWCSGTSCISGDSKLLKNKKHTKETSKNLCSDSVTYIIQIMQKIQLIKEK